MRRLVSLSSAIILLGCSPAKDQPAMDTTAAAPAMAAPTGISLADVAGKWNVHATNDAGNIKVDYVLTASADTSGWTFTFPNRDPIPVRVVAVDGDSVVTEAGPYESVLRKGVQVTTRNVNRLQDGRLVGATEAHYAGTSPDSVLRLRTEGTRRP